MGEAVGGSGLRGAFGGDQSFGFVKTDVGPGHAGGAFDLLNGHSAYLLVVGSTYIKV